MDIDIEEIREALNRLAELEIENQKQRDDAVQDAKTISSLRRFIGVLMTELRTKKSDMNTKSLFVSDPWIDAILHPDKGE